MPAPALELILDAESDRAIRALWDRLSDAGLPSQADHRGPSNAPHVTVASAPDLGDTAVWTAIDTLGPLLPRRLDIVGNVTFLGRRFTLAMLLDPGDELRSAVRTIQAACGTTSEISARGWVPHVSLARPVTPEQLGAATALLAGVPVPEHLCVAGLRHWDPVTGRSRSLPHPLP